MTSAALGLLLLALAAAEPAGSHAAMALGSGIERQMAPEGRATPRPPRCDGDACGKPGHGVEALDGDSRPWAVDEPMRSWARSRVPARGSARGRFARLRDALVSPRGLRIRSRAGSSATAVEVYRSRRADCVGFAYLLAGMARDLGLDVRFVDADPPSPSSRRLRSGLRMRENHVAVQLDDDGRRWIADHGGLRPGGPRDVPLSDAVAAALLASNRGARHLIDGRCGAARRQLERAVAMAPEHLPFRANLRAALRCR